MSFHFQFRGMQDRRDLQELLKFLLLQDLGYPNYGDWVERIEYELDSGYKKVVLAFSENYLVGDLIFQQHKAVPRFLEIKNLRIHPRLRTRKFAEFMLRQAEAESQGEYDAVICDCPATRLGIVRFMESQGYTSFATLPLYDRNAPDIVMLKFLNEEKRKAMMFSARSIISAKAVRAPNSN